MIDRAFYFASNSGKNGILVLLYIFFYITFTYFRARVSQIIICLLSEIYEKKLKLFGKKTETFREETETFREETETFREETETFREETETFREETPFSTKKAKTLAQTTIF
jgi:hypothetical protein